MKKLMKAILLVTVLTPLMSSAQSVPVPRKKPRQNFEANILEAVLDEKVASSLLSAFENSRRLKCQFRVQDVNLGTRMPSPEIEPLTTFSIEGICNDKNGGANVHIVTLEGFYHDESNVPTSDGIELEAFLISQGE